MKSKLTKKYAKISVILGIIQVVLLVGPILYYTIKGFTCADEKGRSGLTASTVVSIILLLVNIILKYNLRSPLWFMLLGIYAALKNVLPLLIWLSVGTILDELLLSPLHKRYAAKKTINREIDKRE